MKTKKLTAMLAVCAMSAFAFAAAVHAEGEVAQIGETKYATLQAAVEAAKTGDTIEMIDNATVTANIDIPSGITLTLDMNGNTITTDPVNEERTFDVYGDMTVTGSGKITCTSYGVFDVKDGGSLTVENGTYEAAGYRKGSGGGATLRTRPGSMTIVKDGVTISNEISGAVYSEGDTELGACKLISTSHNGRKDESGAGLWSYCTQILGEGELNGTTVQGVQGGLYVGGKATINGGTYTAADLTDGSYQGSKAFYGLFVSNGASVIINDGVFTGGDIGGNYCVLNSDNDTGMELGKSIIICDGTFNGKVGSLHSDGKRDVYGITAYGGKFTEDPMYFVDSSCVSMQVNDESEYVVIPVSEKAMDSGTYKTAVGDDDTYDQMSLFEVSTVPNSVTYAVNDGINSRNFVFDYAHVEGITKLGLIVTDIPDDTNVTIEMQGGQNNG